MKISGTVAKMEPEEKKMAKMEPDAGSNDFNLEGRDKVQNEDKTVEQAKELDVSINTLKVLPAVQAYSAVPDILYPAIQGYSAVPDILASFQRTLGPKTTALHGACSEI